MDEKGTRHHQEVICIGAGPAGLTAAYLLSKKKIACAVLEKDAQYVGGISKTVCNEGYRIDIGGHRFFSKSGDINALWDEILGDDFLERPRKSRIFYKKTFFSYPLKPFEALFKLGFVESIYILLSYFKAKLFPKKLVRSFEDWVSNQFGKRLFSIFFKTYTEKIWGMSCQSISADWAAQRIKGLSLFSAVFNALRPPKKDSNKEGVIKTLIDHFRYPRLGPGMMWESAAEKITRLGNQITLDASVESLFFDEREKKWKIQYKQGDTLQVESSNHVISSMPIRELVQALIPAPPTAVISAANQLNYRDFLIVALVVESDSVFDDNWIYIHDDAVKVGRIQNFRSWSPELIPEGGKNCYGLEYFCNEGDSLWEMSDAELVELAKAEIQAIGLVQEQHIRRGFVVRQLKAYPVYDADYKKHIETIRHYLEKNYPTLHLVGRNGMHKYNNQDHAMMSAMLTVENILKNNKSYDIWAVNEDAEYHEAGEAGEASRYAVTNRLVPEKLKDNSELPE